MSNEQNNEKQILLFENVWKFIFDIPIRFYRVDNFLGITIEMKTNEANHRGCPHCHAKYQDKEISISLLDCSIIASKGMDPKHEKMAVNYVKDNKDFLIELWNKNPGVIKF